MWNSYHSILCNFEISQHLLYFDFALLFEFFDSDIVDFDSVFVDSNAGARGDMNIVNSVLPSFVPSQTVTIPTGQAFLTDTCRNTPVSVN